jgi:hypothetical protein
MRRPARRVVDPSGGEGGPLSCWRLLPPASSVRPEPATLADWQVQLVRYLEIQAFRGASRETLVSVGASLLQRARFALHFAATLGGPAPHYIAGGVAFVFDNKPNKGDPAWQAGAVGLW